VAAPAATIWRLLTDPEQYERWAGVTLVSATPPGPACDGQRIEFRTREWLLWFRVVFDVVRIDPQRSLALHVRLPFGVVNHEQIVLTPMDNRHTRVTLN
jgi:uncharacterized protein YndB with AHSA1/START domain